MHAAVIIHEKLPKAAYSESIGHSQAFVNWEKAGAEVKSYI